MLRAQVHELQKSMIARYVKIRFSSFKNIAIKKHFVRCQGNRKFVSGASLVPVREVKRNFHPARLQKLVYTTLRSQKQELERQVRNLFLFYF